MAKSNEGMRTLRVGTVVNYLVLASSIIYLLVVLAHAAGVFTLFGRNWQADGFCLSFKGTLVHSHLLCFYTDTVWACILFSLNTRGRSELKPVRDNIGSVFVHGTGHLALWYFGDLENAPFASEHSTPESIFSFLGATLFFYMFFCGVFSFWPSVVQSAFHAAVMMVAVPPVYLFTYVNTALVFVLVGAQLALPADEKDHFYDANALIISLPVTVVTWLEPLTCDNFLVNLGGHLWFDFSIPASVFVYYLWTTGQVPRARKLT